MLAQEYTERQNRISTWDFCLYGKNAPTRVAFFQRFFAHYQAGLVKALAADPGCAVVFFGAVNDPTGSGIRAISPEIRSRVQFRTCRTVHFGPRIALQFRAVGEALAGSFDVLILEGSATILTNWLAILVARIVGKRVLLYSHGWLRMETGAKGLVRDAFYRMANGLLLYGNRAKTIGIQRGFPAEHLYVVANSLDLSPDEAILASAPKSRQAFRAKFFGCAAENPLLVSVGRLVMAKRYDLLLEAAGLLAAKGRRVNVLLVGDGPERSALEQRAAALTVTLACVGSCYDESFLGRCLEAADMTVIPGAAGLTVIHSLFHGTPVVTHNNAAAQMPEYEAIEDGTNGMLFRQDDPSALAEAIERTLTELPRTQRVVDQCRAVISRSYNPTSMARVFVDAIQSRGAK